MQGESIAQAVEEIWTAVALTMEEERVLAAAVLNVESSQDALVRKRWVAVLAKGRLLEGLKYGIPPSIASWADRMTKGNGQAQETRLLADWAIKEEAHELEDHQKRVLQRLADLAKEPQH